MQTIDQFRAGLDAATLQTVDLLRQVISASHPGLTEHIKWNAPSFVLEGVDRITLGLERRGGVRVVLHRGAKAMDATSFTFSDPEGLAAWPAPDRGVIVFKNADDVAGRSERLQALCERWLRETPPTAHSREGGNPS